MHYYQLQNKTKISSRRCTYLICTSPKANSSIYFKQLDTYVGKNESPFDRTRSCKFYCNGFSIRFKVACCAVDCTQKLYTKQCKKLIYSSSKTQLHSLKVNALHNKKFHGKNKVSFHWKSNRHIGSQLYLLSNI